MVLAQKNNCFSPKKWIFLFEYNIKIQKLVRVLYSRPLSVKNREIFFPKKFAIFTHCTLQRDPFRKKSGNFGPLYLIEGPSLYLIEGPSLYLITVPPCTVLHVLNGKDRHTLFEPYNHPLQLLQGRVPIHILSGMIGLISLIFE